MKIRSKLFKTTAFLLLLISSNANALLNDNEIDIANHYTDFLYLYYNLSKTEISTTDICKRINVMYNPYKSRDDELRIKCFKYKREQHAFKKQEKLQELNEFAISYKPNFSSPHNLIGIWFEVNLSNYNIEENRFILTAPFTGIHGFSITGITFSKLFNSNNISYTPKSENEARKIEDIMDENRRVFIGKGRVLNGLLILQTESASKDNKGNYTINSKPVALSLYPIKKPINELNLRNDTLFRVVL